MKARKVKILLEVITTSPIKTLRDAEWWKGGMVDYNCEDENLEITKVQVEVIKPSK